MAHVMILDLFLVLVLELIELPVESALGEELLVGTFFATGLCA